MDLNVHFSGDKKLAVENAEVFELVEIPLCRERPGRERGSRCEFAGEGGQLRQSPPLPPPTSFFQSKHMYIEHVLSVNCPTTL